MAYILFHQALMCSLLFEIKQGDHIVSRDVIALGFNSKGVRRGRFKPKIQH
jgi:hypothetical protein